MTKESLTFALKKKELLNNPPNWITESVLYETHMGSWAYGCSEDKSDQDIYGFYMPPLECVFPHLRGEIPGFGKHEQLHEVFQQHHVLDGEVSYDLNIYSLVKYFHLLSDCNPNMIDSIFTADQDVITRTKISDHVRANRTKFLHRGAYFRFLGYSHAQMAKAKTKKESGNPKRNKDIVEYGFDLKAAYHLVRLAEECHQILELGDMDLRANAKKYKEVREGKMSLYDLEKYLDMMDKKLKDAYEKSSLQDRPNHLQLRDLLLECFEEHYGKLEFFKR